ncbi:MAG: Calx-beta domain-containing protein [Petrimonas sp.]|jgi:hypothetical protein
MKKIKFFIVALTGILFLISCNLNEHPQFEASESFVSFSKTSMSVKENVGTIEIPMTVASLDGTATTVTYEAVDGTAKNGINYRLVDGSGTVNFSQGQREQLIKVEIIELPNNFTGDLTFSIEIKNTGNVKAGAENVCTVRIQDLDHPLANILGEYSTSGEMYWDGPKTWTTTLLKDEKDVSIVWIQNLGNLGNTPDILYYGIADLNNKTITIPFGQKSKYTYQNVPITLLGIDKDENIIEEGNLVIQIGQKDGKTTIELPEIGVAGYLEGLGWWDIMLPGMVGVKVK